MGEFFVNAPDKAFFMSSCSIWLLPSSITCTHGYGSTSIILVVNALVDFCGTTIASFNSSTFTSRRVAFGPMVSRIALRSPISLAKLNFSLGLVSVLRVLPIISYHLR